MDKSINIDILKEVSVKIQHIEKRLDQLQKTSDKMDNHIDFVNNVFNIIRTPFFALMNTISVILPIQAGKLPAYLSNESNQHSNLNPFVESNGDFVVIE